MLVPFDDIVCDPFRYSSIFLGSPLTFFPLQSSWRMDERFVPRWVVVFVTFLTLWELELRHLVGILEWYYPAYIIVVGMYTREPRQRLGCFSFDQALARAVTTVVESHHSKGG